MTTQSNEIQRTIVQSDFDGTITVEDVSFMILDAFADGDWRSLLKAYRESKISVNHFNAEAFGMVKADKPTLADFAINTMRIRDGFHKLIDSCKRMGFRFVIVSNGLDFYIKAILQDIGLDDIEVLAARTKFVSDSLNVAYIGPDGNQMENGFKEAHTKSFLDNGYRVIYLGNGISDIPAARHAQHVFATGELRAYYDKTNTNYLPFTDLNDVALALEQL